MKLRQSEGLAGLRWKGWGQQVGYQGSPGAPSSDEGRRKWDTGGLGGLDLYKKISINLSEQTMLDISSL